MAWYGGDPVVDPAAGQVLVSRRFTSPESVNVKVAAMAKYPMDVVLEHLNADSTKVLRSLIIPVSQGLTVTPTLGPFSVSKNETLQVKNRNREAAIAPEMQASMFFES